LITLGHTRLLTLATAHLLDAIGAHLVAIGNACLLAVHALGAEGVAILMLCPASHPEVGPAAALDAHARMAAFPVLEGERTLLTLGRKVAARCTAHLKPAIAAAAALHAERRAIAAALDVGAATAASTAMKLGSASVAAMPAMFAGLCARRRSDCQRGNARGKE